MTISPYSVTRLRAFIENLEDSGVATGMARGGGADGGGGAECHPCIEKIAKNRGKEGKTMKKRERIRKNREEKAKIGKFFHFAPPDR